MRSEIIQSRGSITKKVTFEQDDRSVLPWMRDIRQMEVEGHLIDVEPPCVPLVGIGRSLIYHLKTCGILDSYDWDHPSLNARMVSYVCKLELLLSQGDQEFVVRLELSYRYRNPQVTSVLNLTHKDLVHFLYERLINSKRTMASVEMKINYLLVLQNVQCDINGLLVHL